MPTSFLTPDQRNAFGRFRGPPAPEELARYFHLDGSDPVTVRQMRGRTNRLGFAILLCSVRFTGRFVAQSSDVPNEVIVYIAGQLDDMAPGNLSEYFNSSAPTYKRHAALIRACFGYRDFHHAPDAGLGLMRRLYGFCWSGEDKPARLIEWACDWLISNRILLAGGHHP